MDRDEIERQEFPPARRGYDAAAVHEHLRRVADEFETLAARPRSGSLAEGASTQVRAILEAAEAGAQELREQAGREASDHVARVGQSAQGLLAKLDDLEAELDHLLGGLRSTAESLARSLDELSRDATAFAPPAAPANYSPAGADATRATETPPGVDVPPAGADAPEVAAAPPVHDSPPARNGARSEDDAGARLVALNMALEGAPREQAAGYLAEHFDLADVDALLDAVYASAGR